MKLIGSRPGLFTSSLSEFDSRELQGNHPEMIIVSTPFLIGKVSDGSFPKIFRMFALITS